MTTGDFLTSGGEAELGRALEENLRVFGRLFRGWERSEVHDDPGLLWYLSDVAYPMFNGVVGWDLEEAEADAAIAALIARARQRGVPLGAWVGPTARPADIGTRLEGADFVGDAPAPGMALELVELRPPPAAPAGLRIERVAGEEAVRTFCRTCMEAFGMPASVEAPLVELTTVLEASGTASVRNYVARLEGAPVATASLYLGGGVAGLFNVATLPAARRRGIGRVITHHALLEARSAGYRYAVLTASPEGEPLYRGMGFRRVCAVATYLWRPPEAA